MKHKPQTILIIAAVAVMLAGATSAYGYHESWDGWFNSGSLTYDGYTFNYTSGSGVLEDNTSGDYDYFCINTVSLSTFTCQSGELQNCYIKLWVNAASGYKDTGQRDQKEADGTLTWSGFAILYDPFSIPAENWDVWGTWDTGDEEDDMYFDYDPATPTYSAHWEITGSDAEGLDGEGGSAGELQ